MRSLFVLVFIALVWAVPASGQPWNPPPGIPVPAFGIEDECGRPTHYVGGPQASDEENPTGTAARPRATIPTPLPPGSVVRLSGTYAQAHRGSWAPGTASDPICLQGDPAIAPTVTRVWEFGAGSAYTIVERIRFAPSGPSAVFDESGSVAIDGAHHIVVRDNELSGNLQNRAGRIAINTGEHVVVLRNVLHDVGNPLDTGDQDAHPIPISGGQQLWILENTISRFSGSGIMVAGGRGGNVSLHHVYVGRNHVRDGKQTGVGIKQASDVIVSDNTLHGFRVSSSSGGACSISQYGPERLWYIGNLIYDCHQGIEQASTSGLGNGTQLYVVNNMIHTIGDRCVSLFSNSVLNRFIVGNTCRRASEGVNLGQSASGMITIENNIFDQVRSALVIRSVAVAEARTTSARHNLFSPPLRVQWGNGTFENANSWRRETSQGEGSILADPLLDAAGMPLAGSPALNAGTSDPGGAKSLFERLYGGSIGAPRTDIGAQKRSEAVVPPPTPTASPSGEPPEVFFDIQPRVLPASGGKITATWRATHCVGATIAGEGQAINVSCEGTAENTVVPPLRVTFTAIGPGGSESVTVEVAASTRRPHLREGGSRN
jgi:hypothetical protein